MLLLRAANERAIRMCRQLGLNQLRIEKNRPGPVMINFINSICVGLLKFQDSPQSFPVQDAMDNLTKKDQPDRSKINMHEAYEVKYWTHELGVSAEELQKAVDKVGKSATA